MTRSHDGLSRKHKQRTMDRSTLLIGRLMRGTIGSRTSHTITPTHQSPIKPPDQPCRGQAAREVCNKTCPLWAASAQINQRSARLPTDAVSAAGTNRASVAPFWVRLVCSWCPVSAVLPLPTATRSSGAWGRWRTLSRLLGKLAHLGSARR